MAMSPSSTLEASTPPPTGAHLHMATEACPLCEQPLPPGRLEELKQRIANHERAQASALTVRLQQQFALEKAEALGKEKQMAAVREASARNEGRQAAEAAAQEKMAEAERASKDAQAAIQARAEQAEAAKTAAEQVGISLRAELDQMRRDSEAAIEKVKYDAASKEAEIRTEARQVAEGAVQEKLAALEARIEQADAAKTAAEGVRTALQTQMEQMRRDNDAAIEKLNQDAATRENAVRQEVASQTEAAMREKITQAEQAKAEAAGKAAAAEQRERALQEAHDAQLAQRLQEQREALEQAKTDAVNAEKSAAFEEKLKLSSKVEELQRTIDRKTAEELGEGAEIDLFETLKSEFEGDRIERINRGQPGADILHVVMHNGKECGKIIYDSKNHNAWRNEFVTKLASDQMSAKAEHAILATRKFPSGARQLDLQDGVIIVSPSRVLVLVQIVRQHLVQTHTLRLSNEGRAQKTAALYSFITSERCGDLFGRIDTHAEALLDLQAKEMKAHDATWKRQAELIRSVQKVGAELCNEIDIIIGTAETYAQVAND